MDYIARFQTLFMHDVEKVEGKNASLGSPRRTCLALSSSSGTIQASPFETMPETVPSTEQSLLGRRSYVVRSLVGFSIPSTCMRWVELTQGQADFLRGA